MDGLAKRKPLEEVKPQPIRPKSYVWHMAPDDIQASLKLRQAPCRPYDFVDWFHESFVLTNTDFKASYFMKPVMLLPSHGPLLGLALLAVSVTRFGTVASDDRAVREGRTLYGHALRQLNSALGNTVLQREDKTLACVAVLGLFELLNPDIVQQKHNWREHLDGVTLLLSCRGPDQCCTILSQAIFEHCREIIMNHGLIERRASLLASEEWLQIPWFGRKKTFQQTLCDMGFRYIRFAEETDQLTASLDSCAVQVRELLEKVNALCQSIEALHLGCKLHAEDPIVVTGPQGSCNNGNPPQPTPAIFHEPEDLQCSFLNGLQLACHTLTHALRGLLEQIAGSEDGSDVEGPQEIQSHLPWDQHHEDCRNKLVQRIVEASRVLTCKSIDPGTSSRASWALKIACSHLSLSDPTCVVCQELMQSLENQKWRYAAALLQLRSAGAGVLRC